MRPGHRLVSVHLAAGVAVSGLCTAIQEALQWLAFRGVRMRFEIAGASSLALADAWSFNLVVYGMVVGVVYVLRAGRLEAQLAGARLEALSARLRPHFLYNTLNTISTLVLEDPKAANVMIVRLSELLRQAFDRAEATEVALAEELRLLAHYVAIQEQRFGDRLRVTCHVEPGAELARVPALLLQPLVENAVSHGLAAHAAGRSVSVHVDARRQGRRLRLVVRDDGPGFEPREAREKAVGLAGTRARLLEAYGAHQTLELSNAPGGGAVVAIELPFVTDAGDDR
jgi:LytS/YehU family sensor histidine kinase